MVDAYMAAAYFTLSRLNTTEPSATGISPLSFLEKYKQFINRFCVLPPLQETP